MGYDGSRGDIDSMYFDVLFRLTKDLYSDFVEI